MFQSLELPPEDRMLDQEHDVVSDTTVCGIHEERKETSEEMTIDQARALGEKFDYDGLKFTPEQRRSIYKLFFSICLKVMDLRSPQHYKYFEERSQPLSISEALWPGEVALQKAEALKRTYIEPEDLIKRLRKLKPSDNFELRKHHHPHIEWVNPRRREKAYTIPTPRPDWLEDQWVGLSHIRRHIGYRLTERIQKEINKRWEEVTRDIDQTPTPDLHLLRDMGHSPGGTRFPRYLVEGLKALRAEADSRGREYYEDEEYKVAEVQRAEAIDGWKKRNPDSILADDPVSRYRTWPKDLMDELDEIDREAIRRGRRRYIDLLRETEVKMQELVAFWRDCGAITGERTPPLSWWLMSWWENPDHKEPLLWPPYLKERWDAIKAEFPFGSPEGAKLRLIEIARWKEAIINTGSEPTPSDTPFPQSLLDELDVVWQGKEWGDAREDKMIETIGRWRKAKDDQLQKTRLPECLGQESLSRQSPSDPAIIPEELVQLREHLSRETRRKPRTKKLAGDPTIWKDRLRPRPAVVDTSRNTAKVAGRQPGKPRGITKQYGRRASKKTSQPAAKAHTAIPTPKPDTSDPSSPPPPPKESPLRAAKSTRSKQSRRQPPSSQRSATQPQGVRKTRSTKQRQTRGSVGAEPTAEHKQRLLQLLTPPQ
ncbi:hypothetical protein PRK78_000059 [Emydomyces testavorans]|uniref:Uncharacterized protein n=1 Tax=Emydomyces testavorans TaxID=2070801 RepID=A0AAF0D9Y8_9EURO|nr:hypothetical protein PRK78_000059 [Emydomyces testavorans]